MNASFAITWHDAGREPQCPPNPAWPHGIDLDARQGKPGCVTLLPYPAPRCGHYIVRCNTCGASACITTAGRADDPISVAIPCRTVGEPKP